VHLEKCFDVKQERDVAVAAVATEDTILTLFSDAKTEIVERDGDRLTVRMHYTALGREGETIFHFTFLLDGGVAFEKVCDGNVWRRLRGTVSFEERGSGTRVQIEMDGATKTLVPELTIRGPMKDQIQQMAAALRERIESAGRT
jgi:hypothetical protein